MKPKRFIPTLVTLCLLFFFLSGIGGCPEKVKKAELPEREEKEMADVALIIAEANFRDEELFHTKEEIEKAGFSTLVASKSVGVKVGMLGGRATAELPLSKLEIGDFKAIVFIGGTGATQYHDDAEAHSIAKAALTQGKIVAAICIAPITLANAGVLTGKKATVWDPGDGSSVKKIEGKGASFVNQAVVRDGNVITANGPAAAREFGRTIAAALEG